MNDVVDAILTLIAYNAKITGFDRGSYNARIAAKDVGNKTQNDHKIPTIRDIVAKMVANADGRSVANQWIYDVSVDEANKQINILHGEGVFAGDIDIIKVVLGKLLFEYFDIQVIEAQRKLRENVLLEEQHKQKMVDLEFKNTKFTRTKDKAK